MKSHHMRAELFNLNVSAKKKKFICQVEDIKKEKSIEGETEKVQEKKERKEEMGLNES